MLPFAVAGVIRQDTWINQSEFFSCTKCCENKKYETMLFLRGREIWNHVLSAGANNFQVADLSYLCTYSIFYFMQVPGGRSDLVGRYGQQLVVTVMWLLARHRALNSGSGYVLMCPGQARSFCGINACGRVARRVKSRKRCNGHRQRNRCKQRWDIQVWREVILHGAADAKRPKLHLRPIVDAAHRGVHRLHLRN